jgi:anti-sigma factor RsiW
VSEEIELAGKAIEAVTGVLVEQSGLLGPVRQRAEFLTKRLYYRQLPALTREATMAAEAIAASGLPRAAVNDPLVLRILEEGSWADDVDMQQRWANLLANALTESAAEVHPAFSKVLGELTPIEAATLEFIAGDYLLDVPVPEHMCRERTGISRTGTDNLVRLGLLHYNRVQPTTWGALDDVKATIEGVMLSEFGQALVRACRTPQAPE